MKIRMLGTGYGPCKNKRKYSKEFRGRGGVLVDEHILIDAPDDIFEVAKELGFDEIFNTVTDVLISHSHEGHFSPRAVLRLAQRKRVRVFASEKVLSRLPESPNIERHPIGVFSELVVGEYTAAALPTNHQTSDPAEECFSFLLVGSRTLFYALDGGFFNKRAFNVMKMLKIDCAVLDCALEGEPISERHLYHNDLNTLVKMKGILESAGITGEKTKYIVSHIPTDKKREIHFELAPIVAQHGMVLAYDGYFARI